MAVSSYLTAPASDLVAGDTLLEPTSGCVSTVRRIRESEAGRLVVVWMVVGRTYAELLLPPERLVRRRIRRGVAPPPP
jgi:hypothetical protein